MCQYQQKLLNRPYTSYQGEFSLDTWPVVSSYFGNANNAVGTYIGHPGHYGCKVTAKTNVHRGKSIAGCQKKNGLLLPRKQWYPL